MRVRVNFRPRADLPNAFSPNGDSKNDVFYVIGKCAGEVRVLRVFDRWGELVFEKSNTPPNDSLYGWDGKFKGEDANSDVYVYFAIVKMPDGSEVELKGDLTLLR
ncbi:MAG: gliding motility-associated C-terminal domain-containing protein [Saprospiraceae bacterium]|nr:gliding motility-associated C-terminal domain-containing protein [Saprospiraceae bacterium]